MNQLDEEKPVQRSRKNSDDLLSSLNNKNNNFESFDKYVDFSKHVSKYCTVYLDFDVHSENFNSYLVQKISLFILLLFI